MEGEVEVGVPLPPSPFPPPQRNSYFEFTNSKYSLVIIKVEGSKYRRIFFFHIGHDHIAI